MPSYKVTTDQGTFKVDLDKEPASNEELHNIVTNHFAGKSVPDKSLSLKDAAGYGITNLPISIVNTAVDTVKGIGQAISHPIDTAKALTKVGAGGVAEGLEKLGVKTGPNLDEPRAFFNAFMKDYSSWDNFKEAVAKNPAKIVMDLSTALGMAGGVASKAGEVSGLSTLEKAGEVATKTGRAVDPLLLAGKGAAAVVNKLPERLYSSALKLSTTLTPMERSARIITGLKEGIAPTESGIKKMQATMISLRSEIGNLLDAGTKQGKTVDTMEVVNRLDRARDIFQHDPYWQRALDGLDKIEDDFLKSEGAAIPLDKAQAMKKAIYRWVDDAKYGKVTKNYKIEGQKDIARGIKEELERHYPELGRLNARDARLINLQKSIFRAVGRIENHDMIGIATPITATAAEAAIGEGAGFWAGIGKAIWDHPKIKAETAIALDRARSAANKLPSIPGHAIELGGFQAQQADENIPR